MTETVDVREKWGLRIVAAVEGLWGQLKAEYPELPHVVIVTGSGYQNRSPKNGHFWAGHWNITEEVTETKHHPKKHLVEGGVLPAIDVTTTEERNRGLPEVFIAGERIAEGGLLVCQTVIHEAAHALGHVRETPTTSHGGRYHNKTFRAVAEELGMVRPEKLDRSHGFAFMTLGDEAAEKYKPWYEAFDGLPNLKGNLLINLGRAAGPVPGTGRNGKRFAVQCRCVPARRLQVSPRALETGPITCGVCREDFEGVTTA